MKLGKIEARMLFQLSFLSHRGTDGRIRGQGWILSLGVPPCHALLPPWKKGAQLGAATEQDKILCRLSASTLLCIISVLSISATNYLSAHFKPFFSAHSMYLKACLRCEASLFFALNFQMHNNNCTCEPISLSLSRFVSRYPSHWLSLLLSSLLLLSLALSG